jgi:Spy/CpxP family protein refolding chaperone
MTTHPTRRLATGTAIAVMALAGAVAPAALARHGADDPVPHDQGDDHGGSRDARRGADARRGDDRGRHHGRRVHGARHGADDAPGHVRHGGDDGPNHR